MNYLFKDVELQTNRDKKTRYTVSASGHSNKKNVVSFKIPLIRYKLQFQKESKKELAESRERAHNPIEVSYHFSIGNFRILYPYSLDVLLLPYVKHTCG